MQFVMATRAPGKLPTTIQRMPQVDATVAKTRALLCHGPQQLGSSIRFLHYKGWRAATLQICGIAGPGSGSYGNAVSLQGRGRGLSKESLALQGQAQPA
eukprot:11885471-Alexandrium_andersonii.AAC.1